MKQNRYDLERFIERQNQELAAFLKPTGLIMSCSSFTPTWKKEMSKPEYYDCKDLTSLRLTIEFVKV